MSALPVSASLQPAHWHNAALNQSALPERGRWSHFDTFFWEKKRVLGELLLLKLSSLGVTFSQLKHSGTPHFKPKQASCWHIDVHTGTTALGGPCRRTESRAYSHRVRGMTSWGCSSTSTRVHWPAEHSPAEYFSDLVKILHVLLVEHSHAGCLHWRGLAPRVAPRRTFLPPAHTASKPADTKEVFPLIFGLEWLKCSPHVPACWLAFQLPWLLPTFTTERS